MKLVKLVHPRKKRFLIVVTLLGIMTLVKLVHPLKKRFLIIATLS